MNQQNNQSAILPRRSMRLAAVIPASHWISIGYSEHTAQAMEKLQNDMKKYTDSCSDHTGILLKASGVSLPHHDMMLPHWKKLFKALHGRTSVEEIIFCNICLPPPVLDIIFPALQTINFNGLILGKVALGRDGHQRLSSFLKDNRGLKSLVLGNDVIDVSIANSLSNAVKDHPTLNVFGLVHYGLNNIPILKKLLECKRKRIRKLGLAMNNIGSEAVAVLADFICSDCPLEILDLSRNRISDIDTLLLASALDKNTNLRQLDLRHNDITEEGIKNLCTALYDPTSMDSIIESNHRCIAYIHDIDDQSVIAQRPRLEREIFMINSRDISIQQKIRKKVVLALCRVDGGLFDLSHLNDLPLSLMPRVLEQIQEHTIIRRIKVKHALVQLEKDALSRLFHTLRGWELPLLFENLRVPSANNATGKRKRRKTRHH